MPDALGALRLGRGRPRAKGSARFCTPSPVGPPLVLVRRMIDGAGALVLCSFFFCSGALPFPLLYSPL